MCGYAHSRDRYRFSLSEFEAILPQAKELGVGYIRFTGGEPLLHTEIRSLIRLGSVNAMKMSVITNGYLLPRMIDDLKEAGLAQVIVSIDGATADTHDRYRATPGLFDKCISGLELTRDHGVLTRVNTVVGPHNYSEMVDLQQLLTKIGVNQWELSALKLEKRIIYPDSEHLREIGEKIYGADHRTTLMPMGKRFFGDTEAESRLYLESGITPRPTPPECLLVGDVIYLDAKRGLGYGCSLLPHRKEEESGGGVRMRTEQGWNLNPDDFRQHVSLFRVAGPSRCRSCSTTAAGYSDDVARFAHIGPWHF